MSDRPLGKDVKIDSNNPQALGVCDYTGFVHMRKDLVKQMQWAGDSLVWTGLYVGKDYVDKPSPQLRAIHLPIDPVPVVDARPIPPDGPTFTLAQILASLNAKNWSSGA